MGTSRVPILLALILGGATFAGVLAWLPTLADDQQQSAPREASTEVLVASRDLAAGAAIEGGAVRVVEMPAASVAAGALTTLEQAEGRMLRYPVAAGEQILASKFVDTERPASTGLAFVIPDGMRAVSVPLSEVSGAGGLIVPGDRVDVLAAVDSRRIEGHERRAMAESDMGDTTRDHGAVVTILQDALVLAIGQSVSPASAVARDAGAQRADEAEVQPQAASVTLAVSPDQAQVLFMAVMEGSIGLALRPFGETLTAPIAPVTVFSTPSDRPQVATR
ncbi:MAG: Flp pilus assembly protein CpaB [Dehalococcoidia bacterium]|nr:Flp pilus assembly protein CpaB [Dehalococcoidia bacterium]